jgi:hypothetical protein
VNGALRLPIVFLLLVLCGCRFTGSVVGAVAGGASGAATANPAVGIAVGVAVNAGVDATFAYLQRKRQQAAQDAIAEQVGDMHPGDQRPWKIDHTIPIGNEHGEIHLVRDITNPLTACKELVFSVESEDERQLFTTQACRSGDHWKMALAEPATERWEPLQ